MSYFLYISTFLIAFIVGALYHYLNMSASKQVDLYPTLDNAGKIMYKDDAGVCYKYDVVEIPCPRNVEPKQVPISV